MAGRLVAIVGPSGAGKDSVIDGARVRLGGDPRFVFPRRIITRPAGSAGENHVPATPDAFDMLRKSGAFALDWHAHGISYALPAKIFADITAGRTVVANLSREALPTARERFDTMVVEVTAPIPVLAQRLAARGRESEADIHERLSRAQTIPAAADVVIVNDGPLERAVEALVAALD